MARPSAIVAPVLSDEEQFVHLPHPLNTLKSAPTVSFCEWVLRGVGQVFLQNNPLTGALFLVGIFLSSWVAGLFALLGAVVSTGTALALGVPRKSVSQGLYGFNGVLTAIDLSFFLQHRWPLVISVIVAAATSSVVTAALQNFLNSSHVPSLTAAFVGTTWFFLAGLKQFGHLGTERTTVIPVHLPQSAVSGPAAVQFQDLFTGFFNGFAEVLLQSGVWSGVAILIGLLVNSRISALAASVGSLVGFGIAWLLGLPVEALAGGLAGYNSVLTAIALGGLYYVISVRSALFAAVGAAVTVVAYGAITTVLAPFGLPVVTAPFVVTTWTCIFAAKSLRALRSVEPEDASTPEGNLRRHWATPANHHSHR